MIADQLQLQLCRSLKWESLSVSVSALCLGGEMTNRTTQHGDTEIFTETRETVICEGALGDGQLSAKTNVAREDSLRRPARPRQPRQPTGKSYGLRCFG